MESRFYTCTYCFKEFEPKRRRVQKYCSNSCRNKAYHARKTKPSTPALTNDKLPAVNEKPENITKKETMKFTGVGETVVGMVAYEAGKALLTPIQSKSATKKDIQELKAFISGTRYLPIKNMPNDNFGRRPFYDVETEEVVYIYL
ncbi:hypothetical protein [Flavisericum labens]|uniref:hypothetical protein n=1 Tax=Flavisericum labens TaxID=3377112 RepID=UPI00387B86B0